MIILYSRLRTVAVFHFFSFINSIYYSNEQHLISFSKQISKEQYSVEQNYLSAHVETNQVRPGVSNVRPSNSIPSRQIY